jgi:hypothetical protein
VDEERAADADADGVQRALPGPRISVAGGRSRLDDASAAVLAQAMQADGVDVRLLSRTDLGATEAVGQGEAGARCLILCYLDPQPPRGGLLILRRIKRADPGLRVGVVFWDLPAALRDNKEMMLPRLLLAEPAREMAVEIGADFVVRTIAEAIEEAGRDVPARPLAVVPQKKARGAGRSRALRVVA